MNTAFNLGKTFNSFGIENAKTDLFNQFILNCLSRHSKKDFGDLEQEDIESNLDALDNGGRLLSSYIIPTNIYDSNLMMNNKIWIITEAERDYTTILFPSEY